MIYLIYFFIFLFGLSVGSFLNALIWRLRHKIPLTPFFIKGSKSLREALRALQWRSCCPACRRQIAWYDNIPLLSFVWLGGRCRHCRKKISRQYPAVELATGLLFLLALYNNFQFPVSSFQFPISNFQFPVSSFIALLRDWLLIAAMIVIFVYDLRWYLILDIVTFPAIAIVSVLNSILFYLAPGGFPELSWQKLLISGIIGGSFFLFQFIISRGRWIGGGDIRLGALMGVALGWPYLILALFLAYLMGSVVGLGLIAGKKKKWSSQVPFGVFLSAATIITLFWGEFILNWYLGIFY